MRKSLQPFVFLLLLAIALIAITQFNKFGDAKDLIPWREDFTAAKNESKTSGKPILAYFGADWCGPCHTLKRNVWSDADVELALREYVPVHIDVDQHQQLSLDYRIEFLPTMMLIDSDGTMIRQTTGGQSAGDFLEWLKKG